MIARMHASFRQNKAHRTLRLSVAGSLLLAVAAGCSAKQTDSGGAGRAAAASSNAADTLITPTTAAGTSATGTASTTNTGGPGTQPISTDPIALDACGPNNPAGLGAADAQRLRAGSGGPGNLQILYPAEGTVFPRGMLSPDLMWGGQAAAEAVFLHIRSTTFEYSGCHVPGRDGYLRIPQNIWDQAGARTGGKTDPYTIELTVMSGGTVTGPVAVRFNIAQATIKGSIYYNTYSSMLGAAPTGAVPTMAAMKGKSMMGGLVLRIPAGGEAEVFHQTSCNGCHSVSADGSRLLSFFSGIGGQSYDVAAIAASGTLVGPVAAGPRGVFGALYPNGLVYLSMSSVIEVGHSNMAGGGPGAAAQDATLFDATNGTVIPNHGIPGGALMPMFSPDGTYLAFNDYALGAAHGIAVMKYDVTTHTATDYKVLLQEPDGAVRPGWPFVLPDNGAVIVARTDSKDFSGNGAGVMAGGPGGKGARGEDAPYSELSIVDMNTGTVSLLAKAMGYSKPEDAATGSTFLPFGDEDIRHYYFPTLSPVAAGGYFWLFFDGVRHYGSLGSGRQLWGAAIDISADGSYTHDPSHPAFYLPGQEFGTGNHRAFAALDACKQDGLSCTSGIDCCSGSCYFEGDVGAGVCTPRKTSCSKRDERCSSDRDCCLPLGDEPPLQCIAGYCAVVLGPD
jgi:hypothetical protein